MDYTGVWQGDGLSPLLFIIILNPLLEWIRLPEAGAGYSFNSGWRIPTIAYCDDIVLIGHSLVDIQNTYEKLCLFYNYHEFSINQKKSGYTNNIGDNTANLFFKGIALNRLERHEDYKYLGILINLDLAWASQVKQVDRKLNLVLQAVKQQRIPPDLLIRVLNAAASTVVAYSLSAFCFPQSQLVSWDAKTSTMVRA